MKQYSIGLDIGVGSVGWVCLTPDYKVLKYNNRYAMGVHEFESAKVAADRRIQRGTRRRYNRRKKRLQLLQSLFQGHMSQHPDFFHTETTKHFWKNDNRFENRTLSETLKAMNVNPKQFPTQYHLRNYLMISKEKEDLRLIYLALHHLVKYRGHFLNEHMKWNATSEELDLTSLLSELLEEYANLNGLNYLSPTRDELETIKNTLLDNQKTRSDRNNILKQTLTKEFEPVFKLALGLDSAAEKLFSQSTNVGIYKELKLKINLSSEELESQLSLLEEQEVQFLERFQIFYQQLMLQHILGDASTVAQAKVRAYEEFELQLKQLKQIIDKYCGEKEYRAMFITSKRNQKAFREKPDYGLLCLWDRYLKHKKSEETFFKKVKSLLEGALKKAKSEDEAVIKELLVFLENNQLLLKQRSSHNAAIPYQNNVFEAQQIIKKQQLHYPFMTDEWLEKVIQIISFRIPYYIGPLGKSEFSWMEKVKAVNVTPWNFDEVVDKASSAEGFIQRMTNKCTYLENEKVLPKHSLLYEMFELLNELNSIQIRSKNEQPNKKFRLDVDTKQWVIENIFKKYKNVSHAKFLSELKKYPKYEELDLEGKQIFGTQKEDRFISNLQSHIQFEELISQHGEEVAEEVIYYLTVFNEKSIIVDKLTQKFPSMDDQQIEKYSKLTLSGWGRLSFKLLNSLIVTDSLTVIEYMKKFAVNFMEVQSQTNLKAVIANHRPVKEVKKITYKDIQQLAGSPALKRSIWRAVKIVEELTAIFGEPTNIMVEVAREVQKSTKPKSNKQLWDELGKSWKDEEWKKFHKEHANYPIDRYRDKRLWLYLTQHGKCLYTGEQLDVKQLHTYHVDHIYPRSFVVDNSIDNLALVKYDSNMFKSDTKTPLQLIPDNQKYEMISWWESLQNRRLISAKKFQRLMKQQFDDSDKEAFFSRQLVETRQIIVNVKDLLQERFANTTIHLVKAGIVSKFRSSLSIPKNRNYNNKHHAVDAFLTTILIQFIEQQYGTNFLNFSFKQKERQNKWKEVNRQAQKKEDFFVFNQFKQQQITSTLSNRMVDAVKYVQEIVYELPWQTTKKTGSSEGMFYDATIYSPKIQTPTYTSSKVDRFVHKDIKTATSYCVKYTSMNKKGKEVTNYKIVDLKVIEQYQLKREDYAIALIQKEVKDTIVRAEILFELPKYQKIIWKDHEYYFATSSELHNAKQWVLPQHLVDTLNSPLLFEMTSEQLQNLFAEISNNFFEQYKIYAHQTFKSKVDNYKTTITDVENFNNGVNELYKSAAANATRSDLFGSRLSKKANPQELQVVYESITGLYHRKPKSLRSFEQAKMELVRG